MEIRGGRANQEEIAGLGPWSVPFCQKGEMSFSFQQRKCSIHVYPPIWARLGDLKLNGHFLSAKLLAIWCAAIFSSAINFQSLSLCHGERTVRTRQFKSPIIDCYRVWKVKPLWKCLKRMTSSGQLHRLKKKSVFYRGLGEKTLLPTWFITSVKLPRSL